MAMKVRFEEYYDLYKAAMAVAKIGKAVDPPGSYVQVIVPIEEFTELMNRCRVASETLICLFQEEEGMLSDKRT